MFLFAQNILLGHPKPGCRKDENFFDATFNRFISLLELAEANEASLILTGRHMTTMRLDAWLKIINAIDDYDVTVFATTGNRTVDDVIALHKSQRITLLTPGSKAEIPGASEVSFVSDALNIIVDGNLLSLNTQTGDFTSTFSQQLQLHNAIQLDEHRANALLITGDGEALSASIVVMDKMGAEHELVSMDYVDALKGSSIVAGESFFIEKLKAASVAATHESSITSNINQLDAPVPVIGYLQALAEKAANYNEFA
jgi:hypothetical protein